MKPRLLFVTGSDTGAGKTVLAALLTRYLRERGVRVAGLKPICSGGRTDARALHLAAGRVLPLDTVNPWHFRSPLAPLLAARRENRRVRLREVVASIRRVIQEFDCVVIEGAGGLLSPLGEGFNSRDLLCALAATPLVVCPNRLGAVNQALLVLEALPRELARRARVILSTFNADSSSPANLRLLREFLGPGRVQALPRINPAGRISPGIQALLSALASPDGKAFRA